MPEGVARDANCARASSDCEVLIGLDGRHALQCGKLVSRPEAIVNAMAVGLVVEVWRNSPVEDMHSSQRGPSDAAMFAESTALHTKAVAY